MKKRFLSILLALTFVFSMFPSAHIHAAADATYTVTLAVNRTDLGSVYGDGEYANGAAVTLTATAKYDNVFFAYWLDNSVTLSEEPAAAELEAAIVSYDSTYTFTAAQDISLTAVFAYNSSISVNGMYYANEDEIFSGEGSGTNIEEIQTTTEIGKQSVTISASDYDEFVTIDDVVYERNCMFTWTYDQTTEQIVYTTHDSLSIPVAPIYDSVEYWAYLAEYEAPVTVAYVPHTHSYSTVDYDATHHWDECSCGDEQNKAEHIDSSDSGELCDTCGYDLHTHSYTQTHDDNNHWNECSCGDMQDVETHKFTYTFRDNYYHTVGCEGCHYTNSRKHDDESSQADANGHWLKCAHCNGQPHYGKHTFDKYDQYCNGIIVYDSKGNVESIFDCGYARHTSCESDGDPFGQYSITDTTHERTCEDCGLTVRENHTANTYNSDTAAHTGVCVCGKSLEEAAHTWMPASTHSSICTECGYWLDNHTYTAFKPSEANPEAYHVVYCSVCGEMSDPVQVAGHNYEVKNDKEGHWNLCTDCGYTTAKTTHQMTVSQYDGTSLVHINSCSGCEHDEYENCDFNRGTYAGNEDGHWAVCFACGRTHSGIPLQNHVDENSDGTCDVCKEKYTPPHTHSYKETYDSTGHYTECDCGEKTEVQAHSYTGMFDSTCDCGYDRGLFEVGTVDTDYVEVGFIPGDGVTLPDDAELVVGDHYPSLAPIASTIVPTAGTEYVDIPENNISRLEDIVDGYKLGEIIVIDGEKYMVCVGADEFGYLIRLSDKAKFIYNVQESTLAPISMSYDVEIQTNRTIVINGAKYDVFATITHNGIEQYAVLYVDGVLAGLYIPSNNEAYFCEGYDPETLKAQQDDNDLGSVTIPADYNNAAIADFAPGKTYKVSVIGANDISVEGLTDVNGTVTQTFKIPDALVGAKNVKYVAVHDTNPYADDLAYWEHEMKGSPGDEHIQRLYEDAKARYDEWEEENGSGAEFGTVTISLDGLTLTATHTGVKGFSPFIVYAFIEAQEPVYKVIGSPFADVSTGAWYYDAVKYAYENGLMNGISATERLFSPDGTTTRAQIVTILHRLEGAPASTGANIFSDVPEGQWYTDAVIWAAEHKIVEGWEGKFSPDDPITREQLAAILWRYAAYKGYDVSVGEDTNILSYEDALTVSEYAIPAMQWACGAGIITGKPGGLLDPRGSATRAEAATMLMRFNREPA